MLQRKSYGQNVDFLSTKRPLNTSVLLQICPEVPERNPKTALISTFLSGSSHEKVRRSEMPSILASMKHAQTRAESLQKAPPEGRIPKRSAGSTKSPQVPASFYKFVRKFPKPGSRDRYIFVRMTPHSCPQAATEASKSPFSLLYGKVREFFPEGPLLSIFPGRPFYRFVHETSREGRKQKAFGTAQVKKQTVV